MKLTSITILAAACLLSACQEKAATAVAAAPAAPSAELSQVLAADLAGEPQSISRIRNSAKPGDEISIHGRILGSASPFVDGRAMFILGDPETLTPCNELPGDDCETPWDVCCETAADKKLGSATVQVVDADGRILKEGIEGVGGIEKLAHITVTGKVAAGSSAELLLVNASAIRVGK